SRATQLPYPLHARAPSGADHAGRVPAEGSDSLRYLLETEARTSRLCIALRDIVPVPHIPDRLEELGLLVEVLQIPGVLPRIEDHEGDRALQGHRLMVMNLRDQQLLRQRLPLQRRPSRALDRTRGLGQLLPERLEAAELLIDRLRQLAARAAAGF